MSINSLTTSKVSYSRCLHSKTAHVCRQNAWCMLWFILSWLLSVFYQLLSLSSRNDPKSWVGRLKQKLWNRVKKRWSKEISLKNQTVGMTWSNECATPNWKKKNLHNHFAWRASELTILYHMTVFLLNKIGCQWNGMIIEFFSPWCCIKVVTQTCAAEERLHVNVIIGGHVPFLVINNNKMLI